MRVIIQRVTEASVHVGHEMIGSVGAGLLVLVGIEETDGIIDIEWLAGKLVRLRIFDDPSGVMNKSVRDVHGDILVVSQFTLYASSKKGNRPSYIRAARPETAIPLYNRFVEQLSQELGKPVQTGIFGAMMKIRLTNDGPVTLILDTRNKE